ncbi:MAG: sugar-binding protein, partial [Bacteroidales bacterium]
VGVAQSDIYIGDPRSHVWKYTYDYLRQDFPNINFADKDPSKEAYGRTTITETPEPVIFYSDKGEVMKTAVEDKLFVEMAEADYLISLAALKAHARAGITLTTKNHFGSHHRDAASHLHPSLVAPENDTPINTGDYPTVGYNKYRVFVDLMGHEMLGGNTLLFFIDGLWGGPEATQPPSKFTSAPFDNDWSSSLIISLDPVALESVCFDILRYEYNDPTDLENYRPHMYGADDYLQQAADQANWPEGIVYDPEDDGTPIRSLGIHEHWNNYMGKQYSRNLGIPGGIELLTVPENLSPYFPFVARKADTPPTIDGDGSDAQWQDSPWYPINNTWITYGEEIPADDFSGEFKVLWSEADNALHYLVRIQDDVFVDNYQFPDGGYPNFDIVEVFIDEDRSGGKHIFDDGSENAENAFSYHIAADAPADGEVTNSMVAVDIAGTGWGNRITPNYADHFPAFAMKKNGNEYIYEFTMGVYSDAYDPSDKEASRVSLETGKIMGMSVAYCDNDTPGTNRDNFFGSVWVTEEAYNDHWELADDYGKLALGDAAGNVPVDIEPNNPPVIEGGVDDYDVTLSGENETAIMDYTTIFSDPDGDGLTYSLSSSSELVHVFFYGKEVRVRVDAGFSGTATITLTASDGENQESISFDVTYETVSVDLNSMDNTLNCYPNPVTSGIMTVSFTESGYGDVNLSVLNLNGQVIKHITEVKSYDNFETRLDLTEINKGLYLLEIKYNGKRAVVRFTK